MNPKQPLRIPFSPWLTAIIGGRGSGKSTVVQLLRLALRRGDELPAHSDLESEFDEFNTRDTGALLGDTEIRIFYRKNGRDSRLTWSYGVPEPVVEVPDGSGGWKSGLGKAADFPVRIFSQKQIYALANDTAGLLGLIDGSEVVDLAGWKREAEEAEERFRSLRSSARAERARLRDRTSLEHELGEHKHRIELLERGGNKEILQQRRRLKQQRTLVDARDGELKAAEVAADRILAEVAPSPVDAELAVEHTIGGRRLHGASPWCGVGPARSRIRIASRS